MSDEVYLNAVYPVPTSEVSVSDTVADIGPKPSVARDKADRANYAADDLAETKAAQAAKVREAARLRKAAQRARTATAQEEAIKLLESGEGDRELVELHFERRRYELPGIADETKAELEERISDHERKIWGWLLPWDKKGQPGVAATSKADHKATNREWCDLLKIEYFPNENDDDRGQRVLRAWCQNSHRHWLTKRKKWSDEGYSRCNCIEIEAKEELKRQTSSN